MSVQCLLLTDYLVPLIARPAGPHRVATELRKAGFTATVINHAHHFDGNLEKLVKKYVGPETLFVGISSTFITITKEWSRELKELITEYNPNTKLVLGGALAIYQNNKYVDYFVTGFADIATVELAKHLRDPSYEVKKQPAGDGRWRMHADTDYAVQIFDHGIEFEDEDYIQPYEILPIEIARGCIFKCSFCAFALNGKKRNEYIRDYGKIRDEMIRNYERFGVTNYILADDTVNDSMDKVDALLDLSRSLPFELKFTGYIRLDVMYRHKAMAHKLMEAGLESCFFGIETLHPEAARKVGKGGNTLEALDWVRNTWEDNVLTRGGFIVGLPGEPLTSMTKSFAWSTSEDCPLHNVIWAPLSVFRFEDSTVPKLYRSRIENDPEKFGMISERDWDHGDINWETAKRLAQFWNSASYTKPVSGLNYRSLVNAVFPVSERVIVSQSQLDAMGYTQRVQAYRDRYMAHVLA